MKIHEGNFLTQSLRGEKDKETKKVKLHFRKKLKI